MAILLTGGAGFIGSHTAVACLNAGVEVVLAAGIDAPLSHFSFCTNGSYFYGACAL